MVNKKYNTELMDFTHSCWCSCYFEMFGFVFFEAFIEGYVNETVVGKGRALLMRKYSR